eukprot:TRINITY_DN2742_c0_g1_i11.p1 TRINITY_DN2742_c0_g1~~TRINITY_DN2742_c0_g1_i11.p1  ORF type:complete len:305 (+),score=103.71 TRINITY_DN2742_c0_g1_i11:748-1662(+)
MFGTTLKRAMLGAGAGVGIGMAWKQQEVSAFWGKQTSPVSNLAAIRKQVEDLLDDRPQYGPEFVRLAWHSSGTYNRKAGNGGNRGTMDMEPESKDGANAGLGVPRSALEQVVKAHPEMTKADLWVLASLISIDAMGGPKIPFYYGREAGKVCPPTGRLPDAAQGQDHIRAVFTEGYGFNDEEIVALIGAHAIGGCNKDRSGFEGPWTHDPYGFTNSFYTELLNKHWEINPATAGTPNQQYQDRETKSLMMLPADMALVKDPVFLSWVKKYAADEELFFKNFTAAYVKLVNLGYDQSKLQVTSDY